MLARVAAGVAAVERELAHSPPRLVVRLTVCGEAPEDPGGGGGGAGGGAGPWVRVELLHDRFHQAMAAPARVRCDWGPGGGGVGSSSGPYYS